MPLVAREHTALTSLLTRTADNAAFYAVLTGADAVRDISEKMGYCDEPRYRLIRVDRRLDKAGDNEFEIALVDDAEKTVAYYDKVTLLHFPKVSSRYVARNQVWRSAAMRHSLVLRDVSLKVLFRYLVQEYDLLLTEDAVKGVGKFYWHRQVSRAIALGLHVYTYEDAAQSLRPIPTQRVLNDIVDLAWSGADQGSLQALISRFPLASQKA
ncbi:MULTISPECIES: hypothetical protein [Pseudomonas]|uniref:Uncharacterized protein n=1 Tax=Pseudomonas putida TaxID=303 RepID=A0AAW6PUV8_PSEPU|nr:MULTISPECIES: hypothetical protein [Pseudomonas]MBH3469058.1 hypothetical protein [Pseudomonas putida]MCE0778707.1 hypothetical protein [Pseudomonas sp. NMI542_15]MDF3873801.1 hypothetical protein [Pseudomonas putida]MDF3880080.1 hypothetical protein [Pseudomonas putida]GLO06566.1 hypothetical protein PPUJ20005_05340 [Pseudomonas putida]